MKNVNQLMAEAEAIQNQMAFWKDMQDGSYEMALDNSGYYVIMDQIKQLLEDSLEVSL
jgi:hypothetical protein